MIVNAYIVTCPVEWWFHNKLLTILLLMQCMQWYHSDVYTHAPVDDNSAMCVIHGLAATKELHIYQNTNCTSISSMSRTNINILELHQILCYTDKLSIHAHKSTCSIFTIIRFHGNLTSLVLSITKSCSIYAALILVTKGKGIRNCFIHDLTFDLDVLATTQ